MDQVIDTVDTTSAPVIVAIVASAGGLEAISVLLQSLPKSAPAIYVVAQHMSPSHKSLLTTLLARETALAVEELHGDVKPEANTIYITPPNSDIIVEDGCLKLVAPAGHPASPKPSGDRLFKSLAEDQGEHSVGIVLSGTGSDGSYGVQAIREVGGITIAQDTASAKYDGMPNSAIETGCVDLTLTPDQVGQHLERILARPRDFDGLRKLTQQPTSLTDLLQILLARTRVDFREYKENTLNRRIGRRIAALGVENYEEYVKYCRTSPEEVDALHRDLLISVTRFFRDPDQYSQLASAIADMVETNTARPLRVWIAGVATGEEAYSIAILLAEALGGLDELRRNQVQIFATDIDTRALDIARAGVYPNAALQDIPDEYRDTYFTMQKDKIAVHADLRSVILFSEHNVFQDPPFLNVDLVSLRNVLIYFNTALQEKVLTRIHYALSDNGLLFLGTSETATVLSAHFEGVEGTDKVFVKRRLSPRGKTDYLPASRFPESPVTRYQIPTTPVAQDTTTPGNDLFEALLSAVVTRGFLTTRMGEIVRVIGDVSDIIHLNADTGLRMNVRLLVPELRDEAMNLIAVSHRSGEHRAGTWTNHGDSGLQQVRLNCFPMKLERGAEYTFVLSVEERERGIDPNRQLEDLSEAERLAFLDEMEREVVSMREALQQTVEELQTSNEELQSTNEELQSTNEELQAANEELETSNEELQSTNEELVTVNEELQINTQSVDRLSTEMQATFDSVLAPVFMVDEALQIQHASRGGLEYLGMDSLPPSGLHLSNCHVPEGIQSLVELCITATQTNEPVTAQTTNLETVTSVTVAPFNSARFGGGGMTIVIQNTPTFATAQVMAMMDQFGDMGHWMVHVPSLSLHWSRNVFKIHGMAGASSPPSLDRAIEAYHPDDRDRVRDAVNLALETAGNFSFEARLVRADNGAVVHVHSRGAAVTDSAGKVVKLVGVFRDANQSITQEILLDQVGAVQDRMGIGFYSYDIANDKPYWSKGLYRLLGYDPDAHDPTIQSGLEMIAERDRERVAALSQKAIEKAEPFEYEAHLLIRDGTELPCRAFGAVRVDETGRPSHVYGGFEVTGS